MEMQTIVGFACFVMCFSRLQSFHNKDYLRRSLSLKCEENSGDLENWSNPFSWDKGKTPGANQNVTITRPILLDTTPPELFSITIESGGRLVWGSDGDYSLRLHYILVKSGGEMHIGSEDCKFLAKASITLLGEPGELDITGFGEKFIGVQSGGTLELHGQDKLSWTKVTKTVPKFDLSLGQKFGHKELEGTQHWDGVFAYQFTPDGTYVNRLFRSISHNRQKSVDWNIGKLKKFMDGVADGNILAFATQRDHNRRGSDHSALYDLIDSVAGPNKLRQIGSKSAYALVTVKGQPSSTVDSLSHVDLNSNSDSAYARVERAMTVNGEDLQLVVESYYNARRRWMGYSNFRVMDTMYSNPIIDLVDEPRGWKAGDRIFVTSTDYDWQQVEERTLMSCPTCTATQIKVDKPFEYEHFGEIVKNVDMRAEVGLMTRNILIRGEVSKDQTNGGHVKFLKGFKSVRVEGVELTKMGQPMKLGRYPLHYHMCDNLTDSTMYPTPSYIRKNSIHHTQFRCLTIHGTHGAHVTENVCYDTFGHGFFIEDGGEKETYYYRNLGLGQRRWRGRIKVPETGTIPTDKTATTFWLTNPKTTLIGNVAAGGDGAGMWFVYPDIPTGPSSTMNLMAEREARRTKITKFENNVCHSYNKAGLFVDNIEQDDLTVKGYNQYNPRENPLDRKSPSVPVLFNRLTAYKNRRQNAWVRGAWIQIANSSFSDSLVGLTMLREQGLFRHLENSVIIGESKNAGEPERVRLRDGSRMEWHRSVPAPWDMNHPRGGYRLLHGPEKLHNVFFDGFKSTDLYPAGAMMFRRCKKSTTARSNANNIRFGFDDSAGTGNRYMDNSTVDSCPNDAEFDLNMVAVTASDGSRSQVVNNSPFLTTSQCSVRDNWNLASCPHNYAQVEARYSGDDEFTVMRTDAPHPSYTTEKTFMAISDGSHNYLMTVEGDMPDEVVFRGVGISKSSTVRIGVCVPRDAEISAWYFPGTRWSAASRVCNLRTVDTDTKGGKFYFDEEVGVLFFKLVGDKDYTSGENNECPNKKCPMFKLRINNGDLTDNDCRTRFKNVLQYVEPATGVALQDSSVLPSDGENPPSGWGAGSTYP